MAYKVPNPLPLAARLRTVAREEGARAAFGRVATYSRLHFAQTSVGKAVGFGNSVRSTYALGSVWTDLARSGVFFGAPRSDTAGHLAIIAESSLPQCTKYRVQQMATLAKSMGLEATIADHREEADALTALQMATHVMFYRLEPSHRAWMYLYEARRLGLPVLYDLDDPLFSVPAIAGASAHLPQALVRHFTDAAPGFLAMMSACDAISVSTPVLAAEARRLLSRPVFVRRNFADDDTLSHDAWQTPGPRDGLTLACPSGSDGRHGDLAAILPVLERFLEQDPTRHLILMGHGMEGHAGLSPHVAKQVHQEPFRDYDQYVSALARADAVLVPLADDPFNACKSAVRVIDAAAAGRPAIASPVGDLPNSVVPGETGWLAATPEDWWESLQALAAMPDRGRGMGAAARCKAQTDMSAPEAPDLTDPGLLEWLRT